MTSQLALDLPFLVWSCKKKAGVGRFASQQEARKFRLDNKGSEEFGDMLTLWDDKPDGTPWPDDRAATPAQRKAWML